MNNVKLTRISRKLKYTDCFGKNRSMGPELIRDNLSTSSGGDGGGRS